MNSFVSISLVYGVSFFLSPSLYLCLSIYEGLLEKPFDFLSFQSHCNLNVCTFVVYEVFNRKNIFWHVG